MTQKLLLPKNTILFILISLTVLGLSCLLSQKSVIELFILCSLFAYLSFLAILDHRKRIIPNRFTLIPIPIILLAGYCYPNIYEFPFTESRLLTPILGSLISGVIFGSCYFIPKTRLGGGDVKLSLLIGGMTGFPMCLASFFISLAIFSMSLISTANRQGSLKMTPLAPSLYTGTLISVVVAQRI